MSEPRKNHLNIDGGQVGNDENIASYKPILEADSDVKSSKSNLAKTKSKEKVSADGAEEKLLEKEDEAKIVTRVDMADAKYVVGDHRNGDAKIELDANKKFSGLTKEELLKYAEDPFWVRLRWLMFILFWALWVCMLVGAIVIIVRAPKCPAAAPRQWYEKGPLIDMCDVNDFKDIESEFEFLKSAKVEGVFISGDIVGETYDVLEESKPDILDGFKKFTEKAKQHGLKVIVELVANYVPITHRWFTLSENKTGEYTDYFVWAKGGSFDDSEPPKRKAPNNWISTYNESAWSASEARDQFYLHQYEARHADLNFSNPAVVARFDTVITRWMAAGAAGIRLVHARQLLVSPSLADEPRVSGAGGGAGGGGGAEAYAHTQYASLRHQHTRDQPPLDALLCHWAALADHHASTAGAPDTGVSVFTLREESAAVAELWLLAHNVSCLRPPSAAPLLATPTAPAASTPRLADHLADRLAQHWPALQLLFDEESEDDEGLGGEVAAFALLLPAAPVLKPSQLREVNSTQPAAWLQSVLKLREESSLQHGNMSLAAIPAQSAHNNTHYLLGCARWKAGHTGYVAVWNPGAAARADLAPLHSLPAALTLYHVSRRVDTLQLYDSTILNSKDVLVPAHSTVVFSYVPVTDM